MYSIVLRSSGDSTSLIPLELVLLYRKDARQLYVWPTSHNQTEIGLMAELVAVGNELTHLMQKETRHGITTHISVGFRYYPTGLIRTHINSRLRRSVRFFSPLLIFDEYNQ